MRLIKMIGLAAITAVAAMAFVGASSAMAGNTALCETNTEPCTSAATTAHFVDKGGFLLSSVVNVTCLEALLSASVLALGAPQVAHVTELTYSHCLTGTGGNCTVKAESLGLLSGLRTAADTGTLTDVGTTVRVTCGVLINCVYGGNELVGHGLSAGLSTENGNVSYSKAEVQRVSGFCPEKGFLDANFISLTPLWIKS